MKEDKFIMFKNRLLKVFRHLSRQARRLNLGCYRIYDHDLPEFPLCIERYEDSLYVAEYKRAHGMTEMEHNSWLEGCLQVAREVIPVSKDEIYLKLRQRKPGRLGQYQRFGQVNNEKLVSENGFKFIVNLHDYLDTGLFLDHRLTRQMVREASSGKKVLNLFAYTGSFSVYAAAGEAAEVLTVDLSGTYLDWAKRNMMLNGYLNESKYRYLREDVMQFLPQAGKNEFDLVVLDPPTFSNSKRMPNFLDIQRDHAALINQCMEALKPGGLLFFSTNYRKFILDQQAINASVIKDITRQTTPFDFVGRMTRLCYHIIK